MFDSMRNAAKLAGMLKDLPRIRARMEEVKAELAQRSVEGSAGGGAVVVAINGKLRVERVEISPALAAGVANDPESRSFAEQLLVDAMNDAVEKAQTMITTRLAEAARELDVPLPEGGIEGLLR